MPLYLTASHSSRVQKPGKGPTVRHSSLSTPPRSSQARPKPVARPRARTTAGRLSVGDEAASGGGGGGAAAADEKLDATGAVLSSIFVPSVSDVPTALDHSIAMMFCELPERAGMNSTRIAKVLNFQKSIPPLV